jgi:Ca2+-binding EF-hand superfamily protein
MKYLIPALALLVAVPVSAQSPEQPNPGQLFLQTFDADKDGRVSKDEYVKPQVQQIEKQFDYLDKNKDGQVDAGEAEAFAAEMRQRAEQMQKQYGGQKHP